MIFEKRPLIEKSVLQKIFRQQPDENAVIELNNILASVPIREITSETVTAIEGKYQLNLKKSFRLNLEEFYLVFFNECLGVDFKISEASLNDLENFRRVLGFDLSEVGALHNKLAFEHYRSVFTKRLSNSSRAKEAEKKLDTLIETLQLPIKEITALRCLEFKRYTDKIFSRIIENNRFSRSDEELINTLSNELQIPVSIDKSLNAKLPRAKYLWDLENLELPIVSTDVLLQKNEICHCKVSNVHWYEFRSTKGIRSPKLLYSGQLYLTNKRLIFESVEKNTSIKLSVITGVFEYENCLEIRKESGRNPLFDMKDRETFGILVTRLLEQY